MTTTQSTFDHKKVKTSGDMNCWKWEFLYFGKTFFLIIHLISVTIQQQLLKRIHVVKCTYGFLEVKQKFCSDKEIITKTVFKVLPKDFAQSSEFNWRFYMNLFLSFFFNKKIWHELEKIWNLCELVWNNLPGSMDWHILASVPFH